MQFIKNVSKFAYIYFNWCTSSTISWSYGKNYKRKAPELYVVLKHTWMAWTYIWFFVHPFSCVNLLSIRKFCFFSLNSIVNPSLLVIIDSFGCSCNLFLLIIIYLVGVRVFGDNFFSGDNLFLLVLIYTYLYFFLWLQFI